MQIFEQYFLKNDVDELSEASAYIVTVLYESELSDFFKLICVA